MSDNVVYMTGRGWTKDATPELDEALIARLIAHHIMRSYAPILAAMLAVAEWQAREARRMLEGGE